MSRLRFIPWVSPLLLAVIAASLSVRGGQQGEQVQAERAAADDIEPSLSGRAVENPLREAVPFELHDGDRVVLLGDGLLERAGQFGYLETALTAHWPERNITFRNLGWTGDDIRGLGRTEFGSNQNTGSWLPPQGLENAEEFGFGQLLEQVRAAEPTVILVGYGAEMAAEDPPDWEAFETGYGRLLDELGQTGARVVLLTPAPQELLERPGFPDVSEHNERISKAAELIGDLGAARGYRVLRLYEPLTLAIQAAADAPLTENGVYFNAVGYRAIAGILAPQLGAVPRSWAVHVSAEGQIVTAAGAECAAAEPTEFGVRFETRAESLPVVCDGPVERVLRVTGLDPGTYSLAIDGARAATATAAEWDEGVTITAGPEYEQAEALRAAVIEKNRLEFLYLHPQNKAYIFLFRRHERGDHAAEVAEFERMVARQEEEIARLRVPRERGYVLTRWREYPESWVPSEVAQPDPAAELESFTLADGLAVNLFAADPMLANPICMNWDEQGRLWVATSTSYPHLAPGEPPNDKIIVLEDLNGDGVADKSTVFADGLLVPHSVIPGDGGVYVTHSTELIFLRDTTGDGRADERRVLLAGFGNADVHHMIHTLRWGPAGQLYFNQSIYINSHVETPWGTQHLNAGGVWRFDPQSMQLEVFARGLVNPWGLAFDEWGQSFATDGAGGGGPAYLFPGAVYERAAKESRWLTSLNPGHSKACGLEIVSSGHFPEAWQGNLLTTDFRANRVVRYRLRDEGSGYVSEQLDDVLTSDRLSFRPVDIKMGPDGAIYVCDWHSPIIEHGEIDFHHPLRDHAHGRIWRITAEERPLVEPPQLAWEETFDLLEALRSREALTRATARRLLRERGNTPESAAAIASLVGDWVQGLEPEASQYEHDLLEALWVLEGLRQVDVDLLRGVWEAKDSHVRAAGVRVLATWYHEIEHPNAWLAEAVADENARVRLETLHILRELDSLEAAELAMLVLDLPLDSYLEFQLWQTARATQESWLPHVKAGEEVFGGDARHLAFALSSLESEEAIGPLARLYRDSALTGEDRQRVLLALARRGGAEEQNQVLEAAVEEATAAPELAVQLLAALEESYRSRLVAPSQADRILPLLQAENGRVLLAAVRLAGHWQVSAAQQQLAEVAAGAEVDRTLASAAAGALAALGSEQSLAVLAELAEENQPMTTRSIAVAAWASVDPKAAASSAAEVLAGMTASENPAPLVSAFLQRSGGAEELLAALEGETLDEAVAAGAIRAALAAGRELPEFVAACATAGGLDLPGDPLAQAEVAALLADLPTQGNAARGEMVYRRAELGCVQCHAIGGYGGKVGPDLASLGGSSPPAKLFESLLNPSAVLKEGFQTATVYTVRGTIHTGVVQRQDDQGIVLLDAQANMLSISQNEIEEVVASELSLMPQDAVAALPRQDLLDLVAFLAALGAEEEYRISPRAYVRRWQVLDKGVLTAESLEHMVASDRALPTLPAVRWGELLSRVDGSLPLAELPALQIADATEGTPLYALVQFPLEVTTAGELLLAIRTPEGLSLWVDDTPYEMSDQIALDLAAGEYMIRVGINLSERESPLGVELVVSPESRAQARWKAVED